MGLANQRRVAARHANLGLGLGLGLGLDRLCGEARREGVA